MPSSRYYTAKERGALATMWDSFWQPPEHDCPKCRSSAVEYYDPFFFSPVRTIKGRRRMKCLVCGFIWRPSRRTKSFWDTLRGRL
jgi:hypothetical protein